MAMKMAVESMEMDSGGNSPFRQGPRTETSVPRTWVGNGGGYGTFHGWRLDDLGFSHREDYIGKRAESEGSQGGRTAPGCGQGWART
jgi:hypothetical protein